VATDRADRPRRSLSPAPRMLYATTSAHYSTFLLVLERCAICTDSLGLEPHKIALTVCNHRFHFCCLRAHQRKGGAARLACPLCRTHLGSITEMPHVAIDAPTPPTDAMRMEAGERIYGAVTCIYQSRASQEGGERETSVEAELEFMVKHFAPLMDDPAFLRDVRALGDQLRALYAMETPEVRAKCAGDQDASTAFARSCIDAAYEYTQQQAVIVASVLHGTGAWEQWMPYWAAWVKSRRQMGLVATVDAHTKKRAPADVLAASLRDAAM
jgi:hypothetical protein